MELSFLQKDACIAIGLMSGTSADGIDAAVVELRGCGTDTRVRQLGFITLPFTDEARQKILQVAGGAPLDSREICLLNFYLGGLSADAWKPAARRVSSPATWTLWAAMGRPSGTSLRAQTTWAARCGPRCKLASQA